MAPRETQVMGRHKKKFAIKGIEMDKSILLQPKAGTKRRFLMRSDGRVFYDDSADFDDVKLTLDGNWEADCQRLAYAEMILARLNAAAPPVGMVSEPTAGKPTESERRSYMLGFDEGSQYRPLHREGYVSVPLEPTAESVLLAEILKAADSAIKTKSKDVDDWAEDMEFIYTLARNA